MPNLTLVITTALCFLIFLWWWGVRHPVKHITYGEIYFNNGVHFHVNWLYALFIVVIIGLIFLYEKHELVI